MTGGRPKRLPWGTRESDKRCVALKEELRWTVERFADAGATEFICGMALGCDTYFAEIVLELKARRNVKLIAALSCAEQAMPWAQADKDRFIKILSQCDDCFFSGIAHTEGCEKQRNQLIVDKSDVLIAVYGGARRSGTAQTIALAEAKNIPVIIFDPYEF